MSKSFTNALIDETSPYLLQHAHNPIQWKAWSKDTLQLAKEHNKLIVISIGYAACHWCHVMEEETFEDDAVAKVMNSHFINIKVDREERPDIDQVYMNALQLMTGRGGWPLNIVALPDGRAIWGATYVPTKQWIGNLNQLAELYSSQKEHLHTYAEKLQNGMSQVSLIPKVKTHKQVTIETITTAVSKWQSQFDYNNGGTLAVPKFMMPNNYHFLLRYGYQQNDKEVLNFVKQTLTKISYGGIYDHINGGFSRYAVDEKWHIPHFEKMLYDNAQLVSLYADAYLVYKDKWFKTVIEDTLSFVDKELTRDNGSFYSSLDADSLNNSNILEEGAYYVWTEAELKTVILEDYNIFKTYYNINEYGFWEHKNYVLIRQLSDKDIALKFSISEDELQKKVNSWRQTLKTLRSKKPKPRLDNKSLTSWNALMLCGYLDAYRVLQHNHYLQVALKNADFILTTMKKPDGGLWHSYNCGKAKVNGYLEDYAAVIQACIKLHQHTGNTTWLEESKLLTEYVFTHFYNKDNSMFYFTSNLDNALVYKPTEYQDNVIPASNSILAKNLFMLYHYYGITKYKTVATQQLQNIIKDAQNYAGGYSNWLDLALNYATPFYNVVCTGKKALPKVEQLQTKYMPNMLIAWSTHKEDLEVFKNRYISQQTLIYVCQNNTCQLPTKDVEQTLKFMQK